MRLNFLTVTVATAFIGLASGQFPFQNGFQSSSSSFASSSSGSQASSGVNNFQSSSSNDQDSSYDFDSNGGCEYPDENAEANAGAPPNDYLPQDVFPPEINPEANFPYDMPPETNEGPFPMPPLFHVPPMPPNRYGGGPADYPPDDAWPSDNSEEYPNYNFPDGFYLDMLSALGLNPEEAPQEAENSSPQNNPKAAKQKNKKKKHPKAKRKKHSNAGKKNAAKPTGASTISTSETSIKFTPFESATQTVLEPNEEPKLTSPSTGVTKSEAETTSVLGTTNINIPFSSTSSSTKTDNDKETESKMSTTKSYTTFKDDTLANNTESTCVTESVSSEVGTSTCITEATISMTKTTEKLTTAAPKAKRKGKKKSKKRKSKKSKRKTDTHTTTILSTVPTMPESSVTHQQDITTNAITDNGQEMTTTVSSTDGITIKSEESTSYFTPLTPNVLNSETEFPTIVTYETTDSMDCTTNAASQNSPTTPKEDNTKTFDLTTGFTTENPETSNLDETTAITVPSTTLNNMTPHSQEKSTVKHKNPKKKSKGKSKKKPKSKGRKREKSTTTIFPTTQTALFVSETTKSEEQIPTTEECATSTLVEMATSAVDSTGATDKATKIDCTSSLYPTDSTYTSEYLTTISRETETSSFPAETTTSKPRSKGDNKASPNKKKPSSRSDNKKNKKNKKKTSTPSENSYQTTQTTCDVTESTTEEKQTITTEECATSTLGEITTCTTDTSDAIYLTTKTEAYPPSDSTSKCEEMETEVLITETTTSEATSKVYDKTSPSKKKPSDQPNSKSSKNDDNDSKASPLSKSTSDDQKVSTSNEGIYHLDSKDSYEYVPTPAAISYLTTVGMTAGEITTSEKATTPLFTVTCSDNTSPSVGLEHLGTQTQSSADSESDDKNKESTQTIYTVSTEWENTDASNTKVTTESVTICSTQSKEITKESEVNENPVTIQSTFTSSETTQEMQTKDETQIPQTCAETGVTESSNPALKESTDTDQNNTDGKDTCGENEEWWDCKPQSHNTCENFARAEARQDFECESGCFCMDGYLLTSDGKCVEPDDCPDPVCQGNEAATDCMSPCNTCEANCRKCDIEMCRPGCDCLDGYKRDANGTCIQASLCPDCTTTPVPDTTCTVA